MRTPIRDSPSPSMECGFDCAATAGIRSARRKSAYTNRKLTTSKDIMNRGKNRDFLRKNHNATTESAAVTKLPDTVNMRIEPP